MPRKCCIPSCKSNYASTMKENNSPCVSTFSFPRDASRKNEWLAAIPRKEWEPTENSVVCVKHFKDSNVIVTEDVVVCEKKETVRLSHPKLKDCAVPCIFPGLPSYLQGNISALKRSLPDERRSKYLQRQKETIDTFLKSDLISSFDHLKNDFQKQLNISNWSVNIHNNILYFYILDYCEILSVKNSIVVDSNLNVAVYLHENKLSASDLKWILPIDLKLSRWSQLQNILDRYKSVDQISNDQNVSFLLKESLKLLNRVRENSDDSFTYGKAIDIIVDQLTQMVNVKRKYSFSTIIFAFVIYSQSPSCYNLLSDFLILPTKRYLQMVSSSLNISPQIESSNINYLKNISHNLKSLDTVVLLLIDEIHITSRLDYRSEIIIGAASNTTNANVAKTVLAYMISSAFGNMKEIIKLVPVNNIKGTEMVPLTLDIINLVQKCGFEVLCVITDNHLINRTLFRSLCQNHEGFPNPISPEKFFFVLYDSVHIFKNIWKNWLNLKNMDQTFVYPEFDGSHVKYAKFQDLRDVYTSEKDSFIKRGYKLSFKSLYPSVLERQKVDLADNVFHSSTAAALKSMSFNDTADFIEIIRQWWDIVNNRCILKGTVKRNEYCEPIQSRDDFRIEYLKKFLKWLDKWGSIQNCNGHLTTETFTAIRHSTSVFIKVVEYCFDTYAISYILAGKFTTENLEKRFGVYRSLAGCNYNVSFDEIVNAEKKIRIKEIFKNIGDCKTLAQLELEFSICSEDSCVDIDKNFAFKEFMFILETNYLETEFFDDSSKYYVCGYVAHSVSKRLVCTTCINMVKAEKGVFMNDQYFDMLQRGGLCSASDNVHYIFVHMSSILSYIVNHDTYESRFLKLGHQKFILTELTICSVKSDHWFIKFNESCPCCGGHHEKILTMILSTLANIMLNNYVKNRNDNNLHLNKRPKDEYIMTNKKLKTFF